MIDHNNIANTHSVSELSNVNAATSLAPPNPEDVSSFNHALSTDSNDKIHGDYSSDKEKKSEGSGSTEDQLKKILMMLMELLSTLLGDDKDKGKGDGSKKGGDDFAGLGGSNSGGGGKKAGGGKSQGAGASEGGGKSHGAGASEGGEKSKGAGEPQVAKGSESKIPQATEHLQEFNLGDKKINIGGDGTASGSEVQETKNAITDLYNNSPSFKKMIDSSPNETLDVSVGKNKDNMSWGNENGSIFMNLNSITAGSSDKFQSLLAHEFAHAAVGADHGDAMDKFEQTVAREA